MTKERAFFRFPCTARYLLYSIGAYRQYLRPCRLLYYSSPYALAVFYLVYLFFAERRVNVGYTRAYRASYTILFSQFYPVASLAIRSTSSFPYMLIYDRIYQIVGVMPTFLILFISTIARYVMYYLDVIFRFVTTYIAAQLSVKIVTLLHPSSSYAIQRASSIPTSLAKYTIDYILSPRYLLFPLPAPRHYTTVPTQPQILLLSMQIIAQYTFRFAFLTTFQYSQITPSFKLVTYISSSS